MAHDELIPHLFRAEYRKIIAVLCKRFGLAQIETAEDIASETFLTASQSWGIEGTPANPAAWLYSVAKNKAVNFLKRQNTYRQKVEPAVQCGLEEQYEMVIDLSPQNITDSQLQMMFAVCHPALSTEAQVGLCLRILCGFGIEEIADAFLTNREVINKRLYRAKEKLREEKIDITMPCLREIDKRLHAVLTTIYLLFNEGYYSVSQNTTLRKQLCFEAIRLCAMLIENNSTNQPAVNALMALMCFHASRFDARVNAHGEIVLYEEQDTSRWNMYFISKGAYFLHCAATGNELTAYHLQAGIAYWNTQKDDTPEKWEGMLQLYNRLLQLEYSPIAALNRTYALSRANGRQQAIIEAEKLQLTGNQFYYGLLGELYTGTDNNKARQHFATAQALAKAPADKQALQRKLDKLADTV